jgi:hypothetical protein
MVAGSTNTENFNIKKSSITFTPASGKTRAYLTQERDNYREKVYFPYEETAYFVFEVIKDKETALLLNTKKKIKLRPRLLFIKDDSLYMSVGDDCIKFTEHALMKLSEMLEYEKDNYFIRVKGRKYKIKKG